MKNPTNTVAIALAIFLVAGFSAAEESAVAIQEGPKKPTSNLKTITLEQSLEMAAHSNPSLRNIDELIYQADTTINSAWAMLLPNLKANASVTRNQREIAMSFPDFAADDGDPSTPLPMIETVIQEKWGKNFGFSANITLFNARSIPLIKNAYDNTEKVRLSAQVQKNNLFFAVTSAYYQVHSMREMIDAAKENLDLTKHFLRQSEARVAAGQATRIDILRAEIQVIDAQKELENSRDAFSMSKTSLGFLIGQQEDFEIAGPINVDSINDDIDSLTGKALKSRVELKEADITRKMAERSKTETYLKWIPNFDATYSWSWNSAAGFSGENASWMLIFGANWSIFEGGGRFAELKTRESKIRMVDNSRAQLELDIKREVTQGHIDIQKAKRNVEMADKQMALAMETHKLISKQYQAGIVTSLDLLAASTDLSNARIMQVFQRLQYDLALLVLKKAIGEYSVLSFVSPR